MNSFLSSEAVRTMTLVLFLEACSRCSVAKPVQARHFQVQQKDVGLELLEDVQDLLAVLSLRHDFEILFQRQQLAEAIAEDGVIVRHDDADFGRSAPGRGAAVNGSTVLRHTFPLYWLNFRVPIVLSQFGCAGISGRTTRF